LLALTAFESELRAVIDIRTLRGYNRPREKGRRRGAEQDLECLATSRGHREVAGKVVDQGAHVIVLCAK
jgi:hypothetical protein